MNLGEFEKCEIDLNKLDELLNSDNNVRNLYDNYRKLKEESVIKNKKFTKKGLFNLYEEKEDKKSILPIFDKDNTCFYLDIIINNDFKNPKKIKFEIFKETKIKFPTLYKNISDSIESKKWKDTEIDNILDIIDIDLDFKLNNYPCSEPYLLCSKKFDNACQIFINIEPTLDTNILVLGRCYYNKELLKYGKFKIIEIDYTNNI
jgi:hypothetical protein